MALTKITGEGVGTINDLTVDTDTLHVDSTNDRVGINTSSPTVALDIKSADDNQIQIANTGGGAAFIGIDSSNVLNIGRAGPVDIAFQTNLAERMRIDANGHVTMPYQSAFQARPSSTLTDIAINTNVSLNFADEIFDRNADFNAGGSPSTFTAPVTGVYQLNLNAYILNLDTDSTYLQISIITSNRSYDLVIDPNFSSDLTFYHMTLSALADMDAGDTAYIQAYQSGGTAQTDISAGSTFSGYLVA
jgi:hypothetical protein